MRIKFFKNFQKRRRKTKKKNISFLSSNAITTIFGLGKLQSLSVSAVKKFFEKNNFPAKNAGNIPEKPVFEHFLEISSLVFSHFLHKDAY